MRTGVEFVFFISQHCGNAEVGELNELEQREEGETDPEVEVAADAARHLLHRHCRLTALAAHSRLLKYSYTKCQRCNKTTLQ